MEANHQILCLNMIVKNEAPVIARCLASVRLIVDYWVIVDTGSTDGTQDAIRTLMADLPGELHERPWRDFAHNRTEALDLAKSHGEYVLFIDADDVLAFEPNFEMPALQADSYMLRIADPSFSYNRTQIVRTTLPWRWRGVLHEFLTCDDARSSGLLEGLQLRVNHDGARRRDPQTYRRDAEILYAALQTESDPFMQSRYQFYLAQCYRDCGEKEKALQAYLKRVELGFSVEEVFMSLYRAAQLQEALGRPFDEVMATYQRAANAVPSRAEALHGASRYCRMSGRHKEGYEIAKRAGSFGEAPDGLFVEPWIYEYALLDEFAVNAYWACAYQDCLDACERILRERKCPEGERPRIEANAAFARQKLAIGKVASNVSVSAAIASEIKEQLTHDGDSRHVRLLASMTITRAALNSYYNSLDANGRAWFHHHYAKIFRDGGILSPGEWIIYFNGHQVKFPLRRESAWLDWDTAISAIGHDVDVKITYENLIASEQPPALFLDVGANYGTHSLLFLSAGIPTISFEPNETCFAYFVDLCRLNGIDGCWEQVAIGDTTGEIQLIYPEKDTWLGTVQSPHTEPTARPAEWRCCMVPLRKLDDYLESLPPCVDILIKIDVEGFEQQVICGATNLLNFRKPKLIFESWKDPVHRTQLFELLTGKGYSIHLLPWPSVSSSNSLSIREFRESEMHNFIAIAPPA